MSDLIVTLTKAAERDPEGTAMLIDLAMYDWACEEMAHIPSGATRRVLEMAEEAVAKAKTGLIRSYVSKAVSGTYPETDYLRKATWLAGIESFLEVQKDGWEQWNLNSGQTKRFVNRDEHGRFQSISSTRPVAGTAAASFSTFGRLKPVSERTEEKNDTIQLRPGVGDEEKEALNRFQGAFEEAVRTAVKAKKALGSDAADTRVQLSLGDGTSANVPLEWLAEPEANHGALSYELNSLGKHITGMQIVPSKAASAAAQQKAIEFNGMSILGQIAAVGRENKAGIRQFVTPRGPDTSRAQVAMGRIGIAGQIAGTVDPTGKIGLLGRYIGAYGPEAAQALSPHVRRGAYRYRGTERTPDKDITSQLHGEVGETINATAAALDSGTIQADDIPKRIGGPESKDWNEPGYQAIRSRAVLYPNDSGDTMKMGARSDTAAAELLKTLPKNKLIDKISRQAGRGLPSQGVLMNRNGEVVSQSVGAGPDHYLPFNLANLSRLRGGQYVRTRQSGGLTGEDIFATVFSGARSSTVASGSGVFRIEMAPDFRGGRAMSDKAASMYDTYLNILHTIDTAGLHSRELDPATKQEIEETAGRSGPPDSEAYKKRKQELTDKAISAATTITVADRKAITDRATAQFPDDTKAQAAQVEQELYDLQQEKMSVVNLNGEGYALALQTLQEQYPYFIRKVEYTPLRGNPKYDKEQAGAKQTSNIGSLGFLSRMGMSTTSIPSRGVDTGYERPGEESWRSAPGVRMGRPPATETPTPTPTPQAGGGGGGAPAPNAPAPNAPAPGTSTGSPAAGVAAGKASLSSANVAKARADFIKPFTSILKASAAAGGGLPEPGANPRDIGDLNAGLASKINDPISEQIEYLLARPGGQALGDEIRANPEQAFKALAGSKDDWNAALSSLFSADGIEDVATSQKIFGTDNVNDMVDAVRARAKHIVDLELAAQPFAKDENDAHFNVTGQAIDYPDITNAADGDALTARMNDPDIQEVMPLVAELGVDEKGNSQSLADAGMKMGVIINGLKQLEEARTQLAANPSLKSGKVGDIMRQKNIDEAEFMAASGLDAVDIGRMLDLQGSTGHAEVEIAETAKKWQKARTVLEVARVYDLVKAGEQFPKAWEAIAPAWVAANPTKVTQPWKPRVEKAASSFRLAPESPEARRMGVRKSLGLPLVHPRSASRRS